MEKEITNTLYIDDAKLGKWIDIREYEPEEMFPIVCCGFVEQPCSGTIEYEIFCAQLDDDGRYKLLLSEKEVAVAYWMYLPEAPRVSII